jgi:hypothetical protein
VIIRWLLQPLNYNKNPNTNATKTTYNLPIFIDSSTQLEILFKEVYEAKPRTTGRKTTTNDWISKTTYNLFKKKAAASAHNQSEQTKQLSKMLRRSLKEDRKIRVDRVAEQAPHFLKTNR